MSEHNIRKLGDDINLLLTKYDIHVEQFALELLVRPDSRVAFDEQFGPGEENSTFATDNYRIVIVPNQES
jgi:hypothetical protein